MISFNLTEDHLIENRNAVEELQGSGRFSEEEIQKLYDEQVEADNKRRDKQTNVWRCLDCGGVIHTRSRCMDGRRCPACGGPLFFPEAAYEQ